MKEYYILKTITINLEEYISKFPPDFKFNLDYAYWLLSTIIKQSAYNTTQTDKNVWVPMCSDILKKHPYNYRNHIRYLCENFSGTGGFLFRQDYAKGKCYSYRISSNFFGDPVLSYKIKDKKMLKYLKRDIDVISNNVFKKRYNFLSKFFSKNNLKIELDKALFENRLDYDLSLNFTKHLLNALQVIAIANGEYNLKHTPNTDGRIHSEITRLPKKLRKFLRYDGERLGEVDISASVPTFLLFILSNWGRDNFHLSKIVAKNNSYYSHYMFLKCSIDIDMKEVSSFGNKILTDQFYDSFIEQMHEIHLVDEDLEEGEYFSNNVREIFHRKFDGDLSDLRTVMKKNILSMFNAKPGAYKNEEYVFGQEYPSILNWIKKFKEMNHKFFSYLTLQTESYFMLEIVARQLNRKFKGKVPILTLHDCIITTEDNLELVETFMKKVLNEAMGFTPKMKRKIF